MIANCCRGEVHTTKLERQQHRRCCDRHTKWTESPGGSLYQQLPNDYGLLIGRQATNASLAAYVSLQGCKSESPNQHCRPTLHLLSTLSFSVGCPRVFRGFPSYPPTHATILPTTRLRALLSICLQGCISSAEAHKLPFHDRG